MVMEWMGAWETVAGPSQKGSIMEISGVGVWSATPSITFATMSNPNPVNTMNSTTSNRKCSPLQV